MDSPPPTTPIVSPHASQQSSPTTSPDGSHRKPSRPTFPRRPTTSPGVFTPAPGWGICTVGIAGSGGQSAGGADVGSGIAMCCSEERMEVLVSNVIPEAFQKGMSAINKKWAETKDQAQVDAQTSGIRSVDGYDGFFECDIVIKVVNEEVFDEQSIFAEFDGLCKPGCIFASVTSRDFAIDQSGSGRLSSLSDVKLVLQNIKVPAHEPSDRTAQIVALFGIGHHNKVRSRGLPGDGEDHNKARNRGLPSDVDGGGEQLLPRDEPQAGRKKELGCWRYLVILLLLGMLLAVLTHVGILELHAYGLGWGHGAPGLAEDALLKPEVEEQDSAGPSYEYYVSEPEKIESEGYYNGGGRAPTLAYVSEPEKIDSEGSYNGGGRTPTLACLDPLEPLQPTPFVPEASPENSGGLELRQLERQAKARRSQQHRSAGPPSAAPLPVARASQPMPFVSKRNHLSGDAAYGRAAAAAVESYHQAIRDKARGKYAMYGTAR